jgi:hypothetical protein
MGEGPVFDRGKKFRCTEIISLSTNGTVYRCQLKKGHSHAHTVSTKIKCYGFFKLTWGKELRDKLRPSCYHPTSKDDKLEFALGKVTR